MGSTAKLVCHFNHGPSNSKTNSFVSTTRHCIQKAIDDACARRAMVLDSNAGPRGANVGLRNCVCNLEKKNVHPHYQIDIIRISMKYIFIVYAFGMVEV
jgi:hypothetical protein